MSIIDTHLHIITPDFIDAVRAAGDDAAGKIVPNWSPEIALQFMKDRNIEKGLLSYTSPGPRVGGNELVRRTNEKLRELTHQHKDKFGWFASLPDWDSPGGIEAVVVEAEWALKEAGADGLSVMTSYNDKLPGHDKFRPIWEKLNELQAVLFMHPCEIAITPRLIASKVAQPLVDFPLATTRAAADLVLTKTMSQFTDLKIILSHAGGTLPYLTERIITLSPLFQLSKEECRRDIQRFYMDTALSTSKSQLMALTAIIPADHILYGTDWPYVSASAVKDGVEELDGYIKGGCFCGGMSKPHVFTPEDHSNAFDESDRRALNGLWRENAERLFGWGKYATGK